MREVRFVRKVALAKRNGGEVKVVVFTASGFYFSSGGAFGGWAWRGSIPIRNLIVMASNLLAMASNLLAMVSNVAYEGGPSLFCPHIVLIKIF